MVLYGKVTQLQYALSTSPLFVLLGTVSSFMEDGILGEMFRERLGKTSSIISSAKGFVAF